MLPGSTPLRDANNCSRVLPAVLDQLQLEQRRRPDDSFARCGPSRPQLHHDLVARRAGPRHDGSATPARSRAARSSAAPARRVLAQLTISGFITKP